MSEAVASAGAMAGARPSLAPKLRRWSLGVYVAIVFAFLMLPVVVVVLASFTTTSYLTVPPKGFTLKWFYAVLEDPEYIAAFRTSMVLALASTAGALIIGCPAAWALSRRVVPGAAFISTMLMAPLAFPGVVIGIALLQYYSLVGIRGSFAGLLLAHLVITVPYTVRSILATLSGIDPELESAAMTLGANRWTTFRHVTLPLIRPGMAAGGVFAFITSFDNVPVSIFLLGIDRSTLPVKIFTAIDYGVDPSVAALSTLLIAGTAIFLVLAEKWIGFHRFV